jgi:hypothetical protein
MPTMPSDYSLGYDIRVTDGGGPPLSSISFRANLPIIDPAVERLGEWPFKPNDPMDYAFGFAFVGLPYIVSFLMGPQTFATYVAAGPDVPLFAAGVATSNILQRFPYAGVRERPADPVMDFYSYQYV